MPELGKVIGDPLAPLAILDALRGGRRSYLLKSPGETFSILDLIAALYYVGRLREIGEITRPIHGQHEPGTDRPTASLESAWGFPGSGTVKPLGAPCLDTCGTTWAVKLAPKRWTKFA